MVLQEEANVAGEAISIGIVVVAAIADQDTDITAEVVSERTLDALIASFGLADCGEIGYGGPERRVLLEAALALERITWEARSAVSSVRIVVLAERIDVVAAVIADEEHARTLEAPA